MLDRRGTIFGHRPQDVGHPEAMRGSQQEEETMKQLLYLSLQLVSRALFDSSTGHSIASSPMLATANLTSLRALALSFSSVPVGCPLNMMSGEE